MPSAFVSILSQFSTDKATKNSEVLQNILHNGNRELPHLPRRRDTRLKSGWLFVLPCGTPLDFNFSPEVRSDRRKFWTNFIEVSDSSFSILPVALLYQL
jgi:hypothetical protein